MEKYITGFYYISTYTNIDTHIQNMFIDKKKKLKNITYCEGHYFKERNN